MLGVCPECGTPIRATILAVVDPYASELQPVRWRWLVAAGLVCWSVGAFAAAMLTWSIRLSDALVAAGRSPLDKLGLAHAAVLCILLSGLGAIALVRPHDGIGAWKSLAAAGAVLLYAPLAWIYHWLHALHDPAFIAPYLQAEISDPQRSQARLAIALIAAAILLGLRPVHRILTARSMLLRSGRVERQTIYALVITLGVAALGDVLQLLGVATGGTVEQIAGILGTLLIAVGSMLFTVGLVGIVVDVFRIAPVVLDPPPSLADILGDPPQSASPVRHGGTR